MERAKLTNLQLKDFTPYALPTPRWYLPLGILLGYFALDLLIGGVRMVLFLPTDPGSYYVLILMVILFSTLWDKCKRLCVNTRKRLSADSRRPILYLRPFFHEKPDLLLQPHQRRQRPDDLLQIGSGSTPVLRADDAIAKALKDVGTTVAVGLPQEALPPPGAVRLFFKDEEWQEKVEALMSLSRLVVIQSGYTPGVEWELNAVRQNFRPEQIYFSFLGWRNLGEEARNVEMEMFRMQVKRIYGASLPERLGDAYFISFDADWRPVKAAISRWMRLLLFLPSLGNRCVPLRYRGTPTPAVREALRPVLRERGMRLSRWRTVVYLFIGNSICGLVFYTLMADIYSLMRTAIAIMF